MTKSQLIDFLDGYGSVEVFSEKSVMTVLITGNCLTKGVIPLRIGEAISNYAGSRYPNIEVMKNEATYFLIVLKP